MSAPFFRTDSVSPRPVLRAMQDQDLGAVMALQCQVYPPHLHENLQTFTGKLRTYPESAWVAATPCGVQAYLFAQPACRGLPPPLDDAGCPVTAPDTLHLHDLAVAPQARGQGLGQRLLVAALTWAAQQGWRQASLIAVQDALAYWQRQGFKLAPTHKSLHSYGAGAAYMMRPLILPHSASVQA